MGKIRYLSDGALRYIKGRLDSIEKKINSNEITNATKCKILSIKTNTFFSKPNTMKVIYMTNPDNHINGNINILVDGNIYNLNAFINSNGTIYSDNKKIGYFILNKETDHVVEIYIDCIIDNKKVNFMNAFSVSIIRDINNDFIDFTYSINYNNRLHVDINNSTIDEVCNAKFFNIDGLSYIIKDMDDINRVIILKCITPPFNEYNFEVHIGFRDNKLSIKSINSNYLDIKS